MIKTFFHIFLTLFLFIASYTSVQSKELIHLLPKLLNNHELIMAAEQRRNKAKYKLRVSQSDYYPQLDFEANAGREWVDRISAESTDMNRNYEKANLTQLITDAGVTTTKIQQAKIDFAIEKENLNSTRQDVLLNGIISYLGLIRAEKALGFARQSEKNIKIQTGMEETMVEHGAGLSSNVLQAKSQLSSARANVASNVGEFVFADNRFKAVFGYSARDMISDFVIPAEPAQLPASLDEALAYAMIHNPRLIVSKNEIKHSVLEKHVTRSRLYPKLNAFAEGVRREDYLGIEGVRHEGVVGLELSFNLYNGGADKAEINAAVSEIIEARNNYAESIKLVEEQVSNAWQELLTARERFIYLQDQADIVGQFLEFARKERRLGKRSLLDVLAGESDHLNAQSDAIAAGIDIHVAIYRLFHALGSLDIDLLIQNRGNAQPEIK